MYMELLGDSRLELRMHVLSDVAASSMKAACSIGDDGLVGHEVGLL